MQDFNDFVKNSKGKTEGMPSDVQQTANTIARAFEGKGEADILRAIYQEADRGRKAGTLTDAELDNIYRAVAPILDGGIRKKLDQNVKIL